jgi:hypothetical protein
LYAVRSAGLYEWLPAAGAHVRLDAVGGTGSSVEVLCDDNGYAKVRVAKDGGPWDVTVALAGFSPVSIVGVTGSISRPVHLWGSRPRNTSERRAITGRVVGRNWPGSALSLSYPDSLGSSVFSDSYTAWFEGSERPAPFRVLVSEWDSNDANAVLLNAVWVDVPEQINGPIDILLPTPARKFSKTERNLQLPNKGPVIGADVLSERSLGRVWRSENSYRYGVGRSWVESNADGSVWIIEALTDDMAPTEANLQLVSARKGASSSEILVAVDPAAQGSVTVQPAEQLDAMGESLDNLSVAWSAPAYSHLGASIAAWTGSGVWYLYAFGTGESLAQRWPRLPTGVSREEVGLGSDDFRVNVFATTQTGVPWDWEGMRGQKAVVASTRLPPEQSNQVGTRADTGPLNAYDGIYSLTDVISNSFSCSEEGTSVRKGFMDEYFVVVGLDDTLHVAACATPEVCRSVADTIWASGSEPPTEWSLWAPFPSNKEGFGAIRTPPIDADLCTGEVVERVTSAAAGEHLHFNVKTVEVPPYPRDAVHGCITPFIGDEAEGFTCTSLLSFVGTFYERI